MSKFVGVKLPEELYNVLQEYKREKIIDTDSEAVRDVVRRFLIEVWLPSRSSRHSGIESRVREEEKAGGDWS